MNDRLVIKKVTIESANNIVLSSTRLGRRILQWRSSHTGFAGFWSFVRQTHTFIDDGNFLLMENFSHYCSNFRSDARFRIFCIQVWSIIELRIAVIGARTSHMVNRHYDSTRERENFAADWMKTKKCEIRIELGIYGRRDSFVGLNESLINRWFPPRSMTLGKAEKMHGFRLISFGDAFQTKANVANRLSDFPST